MTHRARFAVLILCVASAALMLACRFGLFHHRDGMTPAAREALYRALDRQQALVARDRTKP